MELAQRFSEIFRGNMNAYGVYTIDSKEGNKLVGRAATVRREVTEDLWQKHLDGTQGIGIIPINEESKCRFGAIDIDQYPMDHQEVAKRVMELKLPLIPVKSKSGGLHLYMFTREAVPAIILQNKLKEFAMKLGYSDCEIFPKQTQILVERGDLGVWINMPYFDCQKSARCGIFPDGTVMSVKDFLKEVEDNSLSQDQLIGYTLDMVNEMVDGPPCLQFLINKKIGTGGRNIAMSNIVIYLKKVEPDSVLARASEINQLYFDPPMDQGEVNATVASGAKRDYDYGCGKHPLKNHCNRSLCITRKYGISKLNIETFQLENLAKYNSEPPIWFVNIQGLPVRLELSTDDLQNQLKFQGKCINAANVYPPKLSNNQWLGMIQKLLTTVVVIEASDDTTPKGQLLELLEKFCTSRVQAKSMDELILGKPFLSKGYHHFRLSDFMTYLSRNNFRDLKLNQIASILKDIKGLSEEAMLKGKNMKFWKIPEFHRQTEGFDVQGLAKEETI